MVKVGVAAGAGAVVVVSASETVVAASSVAVVSVSDTIMVMSAVVVIRASSVVAAVVSGAIVVVVIPSVSVSDDTTVEVFPAVIADCDVESIEVVVPGSATEEDSLLAMSLNNVARQPLSRLTGSTRLARTSKRRIGHKKANGQQQDIGPHFEWR
jgi:hypothetical protein